MELWRFQEDGYQWTETVARAWHESSPDHQGMISASKPSNTAPPIIILHIACSEENAQKCTIGLTA